MKTHAAARRGRLGVCRVIRACDRKKGAIVAAYQLEYWEAVVKCNSKTTILAPSGIGPVPIAGAMSAPAEVVSPSGPSAARVEISGLDHSRNSLLSKLQSGSFTKPLEGDIGDQCGRVCSRERRHAAPVGKGAKSVAHPWPQRPHDSDDFPVAGNRTKGRGPVIFGCASRSAEKGRW